MRRTLMLAAVALVACNDPAAPKPAGVAGQYPLRTVDGNPVPQIIFSAQDLTISIVGGLLTLRTDGTFRDSTEVETVTPDGVDRDFDVGIGTYRVSNDSVFFRIGTDEYFMVRNGTELVQDFDGIELVYRR